MFFNWHGYIHSSDSTAIGMNKGPKKPAHTTLTINAGNLLINANKFVSNLSCARPSFTIRRKLIKDESDLGGCGILIKGSQKSTSFKFAVFISLYEPYNEMNIGTLNEVHDFFFFFFNI